MAESNLSGDMFTCSVCMQDMEDPVSLSCGHNYCMKCINTYWEHTDGIYMCPECREVFALKPKLKKNTKLADVIKIFKGIKSKPISCEIAGQGDVTCDICPEKKMKAIILCVTCRASYCEKHIQPHFEVQALKNHNLQTSSLPLERSTCILHQKNLEAFCRTDQRLICSQCLILEHKGHNTTTLGEERNRKQDQCAATRKLILQRIEDRKQQLQDLANMIQLVKNSEKNEKDNVVVLCQKWTEAINRIGLDISTMIERKATEILSQADSLVKQLNAELAELKKSNTELAELSKDDDHIHFLQEFPNLCSPPANEDAQCVTVLMDFSFKTIKNPVADIEDHINEMWKKKSEEMEQIVNEIIAFSASPVIKKDLRIVLLGKCGVGKSSVGNKILGNDEFSVGNFSSTECEKREAIIDDRNITVIETPCLFNEKMTDQIKNSIELTFPGPNVFLMVLQFDNFTNEEKQMVTVLQEIFGEKVFKNTLVLFTHGDKLSSKSVKIFSHWHKELRQLLALCSNRHHIFDNAMEDDQKQRSQLLEKIDEMMQLNESQYYIADQKNDLEVKMEQQMEKSLPEPSDLGANLPVEEINKCPRCQKKTASLIPAFSNFCKKTEAEELASLYNENGIEALVLRVKEMKKDLEKRTLNIAVAGGHNTGKSALISAIKGFPLELAREMGNRSGEHTQVATPYLHPMIPTVCFWDLPGFGTPMFQANKYSELLNLTKYDLLIIVIGNEFTETDFHLAKQMKTARKRFYFVRSKIDIEMDILRRQQREEERERVLEEIRQDHIKNLEKNDVESDEIFLVSSSSPDGFDFYKFCSTLESVLNENKRHAFLLSHPSFFTSVIKKKYSSLVGSFIVVGAFSAFFGAVPAFGPSLNIPFLTKVLSDIREHFGLNDESLSRLADTEGKSLEILKAEITDPLISDINFQTVSRHFHSNATVTRMIAYEAAHLFPFFGSTCAMPLSFRSDYLILKESLNAFTDSAVRVMIKALDC
ncbi:uncharacterized protein LOC120536813 [Polypterus senegalus]|uniref:uncharacterized protein LOC120536813 n=1 Tax=Polypterus senegalus TaxID=55291 RepID=UPI001963DDE3|nr:uncharacterized protein LOC120536813 [Polypterus senegalus]XP_039621248.1 uncharacterized protein LOC120536813 [Polypterus senegalus]